MKTYFLITLLFFISYSLVQAQTYSAKEKDFLEKMGGFYECTGTINGEKVILYEKRGSKQLIFWTPNRATNSRMILHNVFSVPYQNNDGVMYVGKIKDGAKMSANFMFKGSSITFSFKDENGKIILSGNDFRLKSTM